jgi:beta-glucanase (GH16 family)
MERNKTMNWIIKQIFYLRFLVLKQGSTHWTKSGSYHYVRPKDWTFYSACFDDLQWNKCFPWDTETKEINWNTYDKTTFPKIYKDGEFMGYKSEIKGFNQQYGKFFFKAKLDGLVNDKGWPAIWLLDMRSREDNAQGNGDHPYYYEVDLELFKHSFCYSIHTQHNGHKDEKGYKVVRSRFANRKLYRNLQKEYHLFLIDWTKDSIVFYINGIRCAKFRNEIHTPLQIVMSKLSLQKTIVK